jgi:pantothenate kinase
MHVSDIYGKNTNKLGLPGDLVASSLGKLGKMKKSELEVLKREDICRSILASFAINISTLTSTYLIRENLEDAIILGDKMHNEFFYLSIQVFYCLFSPF